MNATQIRATHTRAIALLLAAFAVMLFGATLAPGSPLTGFSLVRFWLALLGQVRVIPMYVLTLVRFGLFVAAMLI